MSGRRIRMTSKFTEKLNALAAQKYLKNEFSILELTGILDKKGLLRIGRRIGQM